MKTTLLRASAAALAVLGMAIAPAAAAAPATLEAPTPVISVPGPRIDEPVMTPMVSPCQVFSWFLWCRK